MICVDCERLLPLLLTLFEMPTLCGDHQNHFLSPWADRATHVFPSSPFKSTSSSADYGRGFQEKASEWQDDDGTKMLHWASRS